MWLESLRRATLRQQPADEKPTFRQPSRFTQTLARRLWSNPAGCREFTSSCGPDSWEPFYLRAGYSPYCYSAPLAPIRLSIFSFDRRIACHHPDSCSKERPLLNGPDQPANNQEPESRHFRNPLSQGALPSASRKGPSLNRSIGSPARFSMPAAARARTRSFWRPADTKSPASISSTKRSAWLRRKAKEQGGRRGHLRDLEYAHERGVIHRDLKPELPHVVAAGGKDNRGRVRISANAGVTIGGYGR
jgi:hypothetical protein